MYSLASNLLLWQFPYVYFWCCLVQKIMGVSDLTHLLFLFHLGNSIQEWFSCLVHPLHHFRHRFPNSSFHVGKCWYKLACSLFLFIYKIYMYALNNQTWTRRFPGTGIYKEYLVLIVSLANHLRAVADAFCPLRTH